MYTFAQRERERERAKLMCCTYFMFFSHARHTRHMLKVLCLCKSLTKLVIRTDILDLPLEGCRAKFREATRKAGVSALRDLWWYRCYSSKIAPIGHDSRNCVSIHTMLLKDVAKSVDRLGCCLTNEVPSNKSYMAVHGIFIEHRVAYPSVLELK